MAFASTYSPDTARILAFTSLSMVPALALFLLAEPLMIGLAEPLMIGRLTGSVKG